MQTALRQPIAQRRERDKKVRDRYLGGEDEINGTLRVFCITIALRLMSNLGEIFRVRSSTCHHVRHKISCIVTESLSTGAAATHSLLTKNRSDTSNFRQQIPLPHTTLRCDELGSEVHARCLNYMLLGILCQTSQHSFCQSTSRRQRELSVMGQVCRKGYCTASAMRVHQYNV